MGGKCHKKNPRPACRLLMSCPLNQIGCRSNPHIRHVKKGFYVEPYATRHPGGAAEGAVADSRSHSSITATLESLNSCFSWTIQRLCSPQKSIRSISPRGKMGIFFTSFCKCHYHTSGNDNSATSSVLFLNPTWLKYE